MGNSPVESIEERVLREKEAFNTGLPKRRRGFAQLWKHAGAYWDDEVERLVRAALEPRSGGDFLEIGSVTWRQWIEEYGLEVGSLHCINIAEEAVENGRRQSVAARTKPQFHVMDAHRLEFEDDSFDVVFGKAILHHLDYAVALEEIRRVLKPGGVLVFMEPLDFNPVMKLVRFMTPTLRTPDEEPVADKHWPEFTSRFEVTLHPVQLTAAAVSPVSARIFSNRRNVLTRSAWGIDKFARGIPGVRRWFRSGLIIGRKPST